MAAGEYLPPVYAELRGDISDYLEKLAAADAAMKTFSRNLPKEFDKQTDPIGKEGTKAAEAYSGKFTETLTKSLDRAYRDLPDLPVHADSTDAEVKLAALRAELDALRHEEIGVTIDEHLVLAQIARIKAELSALGSSSGSARIKFDTEAVASDLDKLGKKLEGPAAGIGMKLGDTISKSAGSSLAGLGEAGGFLPILTSLLTNPVTLVGVAAIGILVGTELGGAIGGAAVTAISTAGIAGGVVAAFQSPEVRAAGHEVVTEFKSIAAGVGDAFKGPTLEAVHIFADEVASLRPGLVATAQELAPVTTDLARGWSDGLDIFTQHLEAAMVKSKPLLEWLASEGPKLGDQFGGLLETIADHADEAEFALNALFGIVKIGIYSLEAMTVVGSGVIDGLQGMINVAQKIPGVGKYFDDTDKKLIRIGDDAEHSGDQVANSVPDYAKLAQQLNQTAQTADTLAGAMADKLFNALMSNDRAVLGLAQAHTELADSLKENGKNFDLNTKAGQANYSALLDQIDANIHMYDTMIASGKSAEDAANAYDKNTAALEKQLRKAGLTDKQINDLIGDYKSVPDTVDSNIAIEGLTNALNNFGMLLAAINHLDGKSFGFTLNGKITLNGHTFNSGDPSQFFHGLAEGGPTDAGRAYMVGEEGPELWMESRPGYIIPHDQLRDLARSAIGGSDGAAMPGLGAIMSGLSRAPIPGPVSVGGGSDRPIVVQSNVYLDGRQIQQSMIQAAQRDKFRTGSTGLT